jgi:hypothetical protein
VLLVRPGVYAERISFLGKKIEVRITKLTIKQQYVLKMMQRR